MAELGSVERPAASSYEGRRKLYCVPNVFRFDESSDEFGTLFDTYWRDVSAQIDRIEAAGKVKKIFCELVTTDGEDSLDMLRKVNPPLAELIVRKIGEGGALVPLDRKDLFGEYVDWSNCLRVVATIEVFRKIHEFFSQVSDRRHSSMLDVIEQNLAPGEAGMLVLKDDDRTKLQFPADIEVFLVTPPAYDDILRWLRTRFEAR